MEIPSQLWFTKSPWEFLPKLASSRKIPGQILNGVIECGPCRDLLEQTEIYSDPCVNAHTQNWCSSFNPYPITQDWKYAYPYSSIYRRQIVLSFIWLTCHDCPGGHPTEGTPKATMILAWNCDLVRIVYCINPRGPHSTSDTLGAPDPTTSESSAKWFHPFPAVIPQS